MNDLTALRLYFPQSARAKPTRFWHHLTAPALSHRLLLAAKRAGIQQALLHSVHAGYLQGKKLSHHHLETAALNHPLCIELIDNEMRLRTGHRHVTHQFERAIECLLRMTIHVIPVIWMLCERNHA